MQNIPRSAFRMPHEHGAWWTFFSCLGAGLIEALAWHADPGLAFSLALGMACFFLASDWITGLARVLDPGAAPRRHGTGAWEGWSLVGGGALLLAFALLRAEARQHGLGLALAQALGFWALMIALVLALRLRRPARSLSLLMPSALLLTAPVMLLGVLAFGGLAWKALGFWALWACFFSFGVLYIQTWLRGATLSRWRLNVASLPYFAEAALLAPESGWLGSAVLILLSLRILWRLRERHQSYRHLECEQEGRELPPLLPTDPAEIRKLGWEQVAWSVVLSVIWVGRYWP